MQGGMANPWATHFGGGLPGELLGGDAPGHLKITMCKQPSQGDARLAALAAKFPAGAPMPALGDAAKPPAALEDAKPADASGAVASETPKDASKLSALTAKILAARCAMSDERAKALWACMYL